jgi:hypothetical protein
MPIKLRGFPMIQFSALNFPRGFGHYIDSIKNPALWSRSKRGKFFVYRNL